MNLVAITPEAKLSDEEQIKSIDAIIKFAIEANAPIIPFTIYIEKKNF